MLEHNTVSVATDTASYSEKNNAESVNGVMLLACKTKFLISLEELKVSFTFSKLQAFAFEEQN